MAPGDTISSKMHTTNATSAAGNNLLSSFPVRILDKIGGTAMPVPRNLILSTIGNGLSEVILDYGRAEGGMPFFETSRVERNGGPVSIEVIYSETSAGLENENGDGPFFLFSNAMDTYRVNTHSFTKAEYIESHFAQKSQRYQKIKLKTPNSSICFESIGFRQLRKQQPVKSTFTCSNEKLQKIWNTGVRTLEMCTVEAGETLEAWEVTDEGTKVQGQHWAPVRQGTRWGDFLASFEVKIQSAGASWGVHMVANGLIFCLDLQKRSLAAFEGLSDSGGVFPTISRGCWSIPPTTQLGDWIGVVTTTRGSSVDVEISGHHVTSLRGLNTHPILGGSANNTGSIAFGGPAHYSAVYRSLVVRAPDGEILYENDLLAGNKSRTMADFAVGTNDLACTIDGAKRDRACFGGDLFIMGRSIFYSTGFVEAVLGSITLLASHQTPDGYLGNLCPIQAPVNELLEPPTYAFYSLSYALALIVATKEYVMHTGDVQVARKFHETFKKLLAFTSRLLDERGLVVAPPPLSMEWFPMGGPIFGASGKINLAFYDALQSMSHLSSFAAIEDDSASKADKLRDSMRIHLWNKESRLFRMSDLISPTGICQDIHAYGLSAGVVSPDATALAVLKAPADGKFPTAFQSIERWDATKVVSPYASGFAAEALFKHNEGTAAVELIERVWGPMVDESSPEYSGGHWEAMTENGKPRTEDTSLMHGWSTWPVFLLPQYLAGLQPLEPGWKRFAIKPVLAGIDSVDVNLATPVGDIAVSLRLGGSGTLDITIPKGTIAEVHAPKGWTLGFGNNGVATAWVSQVIMAGAGELVRVELLKSPQVNSWNDESALATHITKDELEESQSEGSIPGTRPNQETKKISNRFFRRIAKIFCNQISF